MLSTMVEIGDSRVHYLAGGNLSKPLIVLLHGWSMDAYAYQSLGEYLSRDFNYFVLIPDLPGFGQSSRTAEISMEAFAARLEELFQHLGLSPAILIGHSLGGAVALAFARQYPYHAHELILLDSSGAPIKSSILGWGIAAFRKTINSLGHPKGLFQVGRAFLLNVLRDPGWAYRTYRLTVDTDLVTDQVKLRRPVKILWAQKDELYPDSSLLTRPFGVEATIVPGNHDWPILQPELASQFIRRVL